MQNKALERLRVTLMTNKYRLLCNGREVVFASTKELCRNRARNDSGGILLEIENKCTKQAFDLAGNAVYEITNCSGHIVGWWDPIKR